MLGIPVVSMITAFFYISFSLTARTETYSLNVANKHLTIVAPQPQSSWFFSPAQPVSRYKMLFSQSWSDGEPGTPVKAYHHSEYAENYPAHIAEMQHAQSNAKAESISSSTALFFQSVSIQGYPQPVRKAQPWRRVWVPQSPPTDGKLLVACPRNCDYGSQALGGY